mgnify:CR=1 FL=1
MGGMQLWLRGLTALVLCTAVVSCDDEDKGEDSSGDGDGDGGTGDATTGATDPTSDPSEGSSGGPPDDPSMWVVGEDGKMLRWGADEGVSTYPIDVAEDFTDIACRGRSQAWAVGDAGTFIATADAGASWHDVSVGSGIDFTAVAAAHDGAIWVVGDGAAFVSPDEGQTWSTVDAPVRAWTSVATTVRGDEAWLAAADGSLWHATGAQPAAVVFEGGQALRDVSVSADGSIVVAVGDLGTMARSDDGGARFDVLPLETVRGLDAVVVSGDGELTLAVGEAGVVVRVDFEAGVTVDELVDASLTLHAVHVDAEGSGHAVGDAGIMLTTDDAGLTWTPVDLHTDAALFGIDHPGAPHL